MKRIAIVGVGHIEPPLVSIELAKAALQQEGVVIVSANDLNNQSVEDQIKEATKQLPIEHTFKLHVLPMLEEPYIPERSDNQPFYYNIPKRKRGRR